MVEMQANARLSGAAHEILSAAAVFGVDLTLEFDGQLIDRKPLRERGENLTLGQAHYAFKRATAAVDGCGGVRLHDLRHTCASLAISSGANVKVVQRLLGHKTAVLTLDRYGHLLPDDLDAVATAFDAAARTTADWLRTGPQLKIAAAGPHTL